MLPRPGPGCRSAPRQRSVRSNAWFRLFPQSPRERQGPATAVSSHLPGNLFEIALWVTGLLWTGSATVQDNKTVANMPRPANDAASCEAVNWNEGFVGIYPWAADASYAVVVNGEKWARFLGKFQRSNRDGSFDTEFVSRSNRQAARFAG